MKMKKCLLSLCLLASGLLMGSCGDPKNDKDDVLNTKIGVHKYIIEVTGDEDITQSYSFAGSTVSGTSKLYDEDGSEVGLVNGTYTGVTTVGKMNRIVCQTEDNAFNLVMIYALHGTGTEKAHVKITGYIGKKEIVNIEEDLDASKIDGGFPFSVTLLTADIN